jgi:hypothetical protein
MDKNRSTGFRLYSTVVEDNRAFYWAVNCKKRENVRFVGRREMEERT